MTDQPASRRVRVCVEPLPPWLDAETFLGTGFELTTREDGKRRAISSLEVKAAALLAARLRGLGIDGAALSVITEPPLPRNAVREGRLEDARARRHITAGFSRPGARATGAGRYSLTPEPLALSLGRLAQKRSVVDACCGSGGNTLGFARAGCDVTAIELDPERLAEAQHNTKLYGVSPKVRFVLGDAQQEVPKRSADILFVDPPWGESYDKRSTSRADFPLLDQLLTLPLHGYRELWFKLPASFATRSVPEAAVSAWFGAAEGDRQRIKFVLLRLQLPVRNGVDGSCDP